MAPPAFLKPKSRPNVMNLLEGAGFDVSEWYKVKGGTPAANPKFCYNWSFQHGDEQFAVCLWWRSFTEKNGVVQHREARAVARRVGQTFNRKVKIDRQRYHCRSIFDAILV